MSEERKRCGLSVFSQGGKGRRETLPEKRALLSPRYNRKGGKKERDIPLRQNVARALPCVKGNGPPLSKGKEIKAYLLL